MPKPGAPSELLFQRQACLSFVIVSQDAVLHGALQEQHYVQVQHVQQAVANLSFSREFYGQ